MLQTRSGKRDPRAALRIAVDMVAEGVIDRDVAVGRVDANLLEHVLRPTVSPRDEHPVIATGPPRVRRGGRGQGRVRRRHRGGVGRGGRERRSGARRDVGRRRSRHGALGRRGHDPRRDDLARGGGRTGLGHALRGRRRGDRDRRSRNRWFRVGGYEVGEGDVITVSVDDEVGRVILGEAELVPPPPDARGAAHGHRLGRRDPPAEACAPTPTRRPTPQRRAISAPRASASAAPSTCSSPRVAAGDARGDPGAHHRRPRGRARSAPAATPGRLRGHLQGHAGSARDDPPARSASARVRARLGRAARGQPDAGHAWLPRGARAPRDLRDAGARDRAGRAGRPMPPGSRSCIRWWALPRSCAGCAR